MSHIRPTLALAAIIAVVGPAVALGDLGPHSSFYEQRPRKLGVGNDVGITYDRAKHLAYFSVSNFCLGSSSYQGHTYPNVASTKGVHVSKGKVSFRGNALVYTSSTHPTKMPVKISSTIQSKKASGKIAFLTGKCGTIKFTAKLEGRTP